MRIKINGREEDAGTSLNLAELVDRRRLSPGRIIVEHNGRIVPRPDWAGVVLSEDDRVEIISFVGGG